MSDSSGIESIAHESLRFEPPSGFANTAHVPSLAEYEALHRRSIEDPEGFWAEVAAGSHFFRKWDRVLDWKLPFSQWFVGAQTNASYNCLDLQIARGRGDHPAIIWEGEPCDASGKPSEIRRLTYRELHAEVCRFANGLRSIGVQSGDRVTI